MKRFLMIELIAVVLLAGCKDGPRSGSSVEVKDGPGTRGAVEIKEASAPRGSGEVIVVPALPPTVVLNAGPYFQHAGYFYFFQDSRWSYSQSRSGPWMELPSDRYPKEVKFVVVPALPSIVVLSAEPYYQFAGYFYFFQDNRWFYSQSRSGPRVELPGDRYPKEVKFKDQSAQQNQPTQQSQRPQQGQPPQQSQGSQQNQSPQKSRGEKRGHDKHDKN